MMTEIWKDPNSLSKPYCRNHIGSTDLPKRRIQNFKHIRFRTLLAYKEEQNKSTNARMHLQVSKEVIKEQTINNAGELYYLDGIWSDR